MCKKLPRFERQSWNVEYPQIGGLLTWISCGYFAPLVVPMSRLRRNVSTAATRRWYSPSSGLRVSLAKIELMCFSTADCERSQRSDCETARRHIENSHAGTTRQRRHRSVPLVCDEQPRPPPSDSPAGIRMSVMTALGRKRSTASSSDAASWTAATTSTPFDSSHRVGSSCRRPSSDSSPFRDRTCRTRGQSGFQVA
jgi:hypothetical protein